MAELCQAKDSRKPTRVRFRGRHVRERSVSKVPSERVLPMLKADQTRLSALCYEFVA